MSANSNNATQLSDADLEFLSGGGEALTPVKSAAQQAAERLSDIYLKNHPIQLGSFPPPHVAVPHFG